MKAHRTLQERLSVRRALFGILQTHPNTAFAELAAVCGYDFIVLDCEHGLFSDDDLLRTLQALSFSDILVLIRLRGHDTRAIGRHLDIGANGIVAPDVSTADDARALAAAMIYPPAGTRGFGAAAHRATQYGIDLAAHLSAPRAASSLIVQIESAAGVANAGAIFSVTGVDAAIIGPADLAASLGCTGNYASPTYREAISRVETAARERGAILGTAPHGEHSLEPLLARGHRLIILGADTPLIRHAMREQLDKAWSCL